MEFWVPAERAEYYECLKDILQAKKWAAQSRAQLTALQQRARQRQRRGGTNFAEAHAAWLKGANHS